MTEERATYATQDGGSLAKAPLLGLADEAYVLRALLAARRLTDAVEDKIPFQYIAETESDKEIKDDYARIEDLRADADSALCDAEKALGLDRDHWNNPDNLVAARLGHEWPVPSMNIDAARRLLRIEMEYDLIERVMVANAKRATELNTLSYDKRAAYFSCANDNLIECLHTLAAMRVAELTALEMAR